MNLRAKGLWAALALTCLCPVQGLANERPNILLILADDATVSDYGFAGGPSRTPNIDSLARRGTLFTRFHAAPVCSVSRAMVLTGNNPVEVGLGTFDHAVYPEVERVKGYETYLTRSGVAVQDIPRDPGFSLIQAISWALVETLPESSITTKSSCRIRPSSSVSCVR